MRIGKQIDDLFWNFVKVKFWDDRLHMGRNRSPSSKGRTFRIFQTLSTIIIILRNIKILEVDKNHCT